MSTASRILRRQRPAMWSTEIEGAGGTSFASPIFAGILALVQQQTASAQGNANYIFYKLAATQYGASGNESSCSSANVAAGNACIFYDITQGTNAVPCLSRSPNCTISNPIDFTGILSGYNAGTGYDLTTGLGSVNVANLVNNWSSAASAFISTDTSLTASGSTSVQYGSSITLNVTVSPAGSSSITGTPGGIVGITTNSTTGSNAVGSLPPYRWSGQRIRHHASDRQLSTVCSLCRRHYLCVQPIRGVGSCNYSRSRDHIHLRRPCNSVIRAKVRRVDPGCRNTGWCHSNPVR